MIIITVFGNNFLIGFLSNILILLFLIPVLLLVLVFLGFNYYKSQIKTCDNCGALNLGSSGICINCGSDVANISKTNKSDQVASEKTIEVKAEEIK
jgi:RNA polymerase subunit RPABC4/transcription elongation factor Spt4